MNRLFLHKNENKAGTSNQTGANISGGVKYKHSKLYYDENGMPWHLKEEARQMYQRDKWKLEKDGVCF